MVTSVTTEVRRTYVSPRSGRGRGRERSAQDGMTDRLSPS
ncbi:hypothetical protein CCACVL1_27578 [Corchorus capsularis]|uniref:Uncharacterized protein n=1 Tax=Corchorus capsularis TaxID=210143 RepID=A0A1R3G9N4_COCAP|nr:hypothetical protein CCACVL1_27578 [Corchorus capsularis]